MKRSFSFSSQKKEIETEEDFSEAFEVVLDLKQNTLKNEPDINNLESTNLRERTHALKLLINAFPNLNQDARSNLFEILTTQIAAEKDKDAKCLIVMLFEKLALDSACDCRLIISTLLGQVQTDSTKLKCQIFNSIMAILKIKQLEQQQLGSNSFLDTIHQLSILAIEELSSSHHRIRTISLRLLATLSPIITRIKRDFNSKNLSDSTILEFLTDDQIQTIIHNFVRDPDPRVRHIALTMLVELHHRGSILDLKWYQLSINCLKDDYEQVRSAALSLVWVLSGLYPNEKIPLGNGTKESILLVNDAFIKICDMISDGSVKIRSKACANLGSCRDVSEAILLQTFSKEIMSHLKRKNPIKSGGGGSKSKKQRQLPKPDGDFDVESDEFRLLDSGACGAFIRGLEDEYQEVRNASIDSICKLCMYSTKFSERAKDFLVDMFHDEIDSVRLNAINSLQKIGTCTKITLDYEQLQNTLDVLGDSNSKIREATRGMLSVIKLLNSESAAKFIEGLMKNMDRYPDDQLSIFRCFVQFARINGDYIEKFIPRFFNLEPYIKPKEIYLESPQHIGHLIIAFNASPKNEKILKKLPDYSFRQYVYLREKFPDCFPDIKILQEGDLTQSLTMDGVEEGEILDSILIEEKDEILESSIIKEKTVGMIEKGKLDMHKFIEQTLGAFVNLSFLMKANNWKGALSIVGVCSKDLIYIARTISSLSGKAEFAILYLECLQTIIEIKKSFHQNHFSDKAVKHAANLITLSYAMENNFLGVTDRARHFTINLRVIANIIWIIGVSKPTYLSDSSPSAIKNLIQLLSRRVQIVQEKFKNEDFFYASLVDLCELLQKITLEDGLTTSNIIPIFDFVENFTLYDIDLRNMVKRCEAKLIKQTTSNKVFVAGFPLRVFIEAEISNITDTRSVGIQVTLPDKKVHHFWPPSSHFVITRPFQYQLRTHVEISQSPWTDACNILVEIVRSFDPDLPELDRYIVCQANNRHGNNIAVVGLYNSANTVSLSKEPLKLSIWPKEPRFKFSLNSENSNPSML
ncbi:10503_t:CDS:1 [Ambispora gerdemannii]|uniref:10503_t:CDS:1 n=1 Tax=Ambispora gerdemannii TaxID=144530 RepID=A0A9N8V3S1_9GLOM|nr:10503_t:CDS:1 [Ambispora gerdemannii]